MKIYFYIQANPAIFKSRNGESGNGMKGIMGMRGIRVGMREIGVGMRRIRVGVMGIRLGKREIRVGMWVIN